MDHVFDTERLSVYRSSVRLRKTPRTLYVAFFRKQPDEACFVAVLHCTVLWRDGPHVEWIETSTPARRAGLAGEFVRGLIGALGRHPRIDGVSPEGEALVRSLVRDGVVPAARGTWPDAAARAAITDFIQHTRAGVLV